MNHISTVRQHLLDQMQALRSAITPEAVKVELERAKGISDLAQTAVNSAKVEVDYLVATEQTESEFIAQKQELPNGIVGIVRHRLT
ncbi:MAG: hypothetical protein Q7T46_11655 [Polaromonas sp.]|nr:hypothetical protein [Polaromonas sp.]